MAQHATAPISVDHVGLAILYIALNVASVVWTSGGPSQTKAHKESTLPSWNTFWRLRAPMWVREGLDLNGTKLFYCARMLRWGSIKAHCLAYTCLRGAHQRSQIKG